MGKLYDVVVTRKYVGKDGAEKKQYINIGSMFEGDKGPSIKIESVPVGWDGWASLYEPKQAEKQSGPAKAIDKDDLPF
jgi:hypothetical protein